MRSHRPAAKPLLASEVLRDDVAPHEPGRGKGRLWLLVIAIGLAVIGLSLRLGAGLPGERADGATTSFAAAAAVATLAVLPFPYGLRAGVALLLGVALMALGFRGFGPLAAIALDGGLGRAACRLFAMGVLPAALLFRAYYRQYVPALWIFGLVWLLSLPFAGLEAALAMTAAVPPIVRIAAAINAALVVCTGVGFVPHITTGAAKAIAAAILLLVPLEIALRELTFLAGPEAGPLTYAVAAAGMTVAGALADIGLFQLLAAAFSLSARRVARISTSENGDEELEQRDSVS
jgi:hypothetical protein